MNTKRLILVLTIAVAAFTCGGCAPSAAKQEFTAHVNHSVEAAPAATDDLARAFRLDQYASEATAIAIVSED